MTIGSCLAHGCETILRREREREGGREGEIINYLATLSDLVFDFALCCVVLCCVVLCCVVLCCVVLCCVVLCCVVLCCVVLCCVVLCCVVLCCVVL